jgi:hypothetical protein
MCVAIDRDVQAAETSPLMIVCIKESNIGSVQANETVPFIIQDYKQISFALT